MTIYPFLETRNNVLHIDDVAVPELAAHMPTPFYAYSASAMARSYHELMDAIAHPRVKAHYAMKACSNVAVIRHLGACGANMEIVSSGEMKRCLAAGVAGNRIVFAGVGKTEDEIAFALHNAIYQINVESIPEIETIARVAAALNTKAPLCIRINPDVQSATKAKIATGNKETKFGIAYSDVPAVYKKIHETPSLQALGLAMHIGSQITNLQNYDDAFARMAEVVESLRADGLPVSRVSLGGGVGITYKDEKFDIAAYGARVRAFAEKMDCDIEVEPGRYLVGAAGILVTRVINVKNTDSKNFLVVDAAMNDLIRPTLYEAYHPIQPVISNGSAATTYDVVGPICETGDYLALNRSLPEMKAGDLVAILCAGAYGASMSSFYNSRDLIPEILVKGKNSAVIRQRLTIEQQLTWENTPPWI